MVFESLLAVADKNPDKTAVIQGNRRVAYRELGTGILKLASFLIGNGFDRGDRVCIIAENSPEYIISNFGVQKAGGISVAMNPQSSSYELERAFNNCRPDVLIVEKKALKAALEAVNEKVCMKAVIVVDAGSKGQLQKLAEKTGHISSRIKMFSLKEIIGNQNSNYRVNYPLVGKGDVASIIYTSGTTGEPKGVTLSHNNFRSNADSIIDYLNLNENDKVMVVLPFYYSYGTSLLTTVMKVGGTLVLENSFMYPNVVLDKMVQEEVTGFAGVPSTFALLLNRSNIREYSFPALRYVTQAGGAMSPRHATELMDVFPETDIYIMYGQTEATARLTYLEPRDIINKSGYIGKAIPGVTIEIIKGDGEPADDGQEGEIVAQGDNVMIGYWNNQEETEKVLKGGKLYTGDIAVRDSEGYLKIVSRRSDIIKSGAHRISPKEIEEVVLEMDEVHEVAVIGSEDELLGAVIKAVIVLNDGCRVESKKIQKHCRTKLAPYKIPKEVVFVEDLPKTSSGKVQKHLLERPEEAIER